MKDKEKRRKKKSHTMIVLTHKDNMGKASFALILAFAFMLDTFKLLFRMIGVLCLVGVVAGGIGGVILCKKIEPYYNEYRAFAEDKVQASDISTFRSTENSYIYDSDDNLIVKLRSDKDMDWVEYADMPKYVIDAYVAVEDRTFWTNPGYDLKGMIRVGLRAVQTKGKELHGASTITQQLARNIFLTHEVSLERKGKEILLASSLTNKFTKEQIMEFYINNICYANAYYGIGSASKGYFNKNVNELSLSEIAYLCAIPNSPSYYDPYVHPDRALKRRDKILGDMLEMGYISESEYNKAVNEKIIIEKPVYEFNNYETTYAIDCAVKYLMKLDKFEFKYEFKDDEDYKNYNTLYSEKYGECKSKLYSGGYKVYTTIDMDKQKKAQEILNEKLLFNEEVNEETGVYELQGALTVIDNESGKVVAIIGGREQEEANTTYSLNRAFQSYRQPGSSIKPLVVYTPSIERGWMPGEIVKDISISAAKHGNVDVETLGGTEMTMRSALEQSKNGVAWYLYSLMGPRNGVDYLHNMEFTKIVPDDYYTSTSLGGLTYGVTTVEMASAYSALANHGYWREPTCIRKILDKDGNNIYIAEEGIQAYDELAADIAIDMMQGVIKRGTAAKLGWSSKVEAAAKTGTTNDNKDGWLCGVTPYYTVSVWVGYDKPKTMNGLWGNSYPGQIWKDVMSYLVEPFEEGKFLEIDYTPEQYEKVYGENYFEYVPGRESTEEMYEGNSDYTVRDYRVDRLLGEIVSEETEKLYSINMVNTNYVAELQNQYNRVQLRMSEIKSGSYKAELQTELDKVFNKCIYDVTLLTNNMLGGTITEVDPTNGAIITLDPETGLTVVFDPSTNTTFTVVQPDKIQKP